MRAFYASLFSTMAPHFERLQDLELRETTRRSTAEAVAAAHEKVLCYYIILFFTRILCFIIFLSIILFICLFSFFVYFFYEFSSNFIPHHIHYYFYSFIFLPLFHTTNHQYHFPSILTFQTTDT